MAFNTQGAAAGAGTGAAFSPWGAVAGGVLGGFLSGRGQGGTQAPISPGQMWGGLQTLNPWLYGALTNRWVNGASPTSGLGYQFSQMANNPGYIDPRVMNLPYAQIEQGANTNLQRFGSMIGRSNMAGSGLANMYAMANLATRGQQRAGVAQQYSLWREQQRRNDINSLMQYMNQLYGVQQGTQTLPYSNSQLAGNAILGGLAAYGGMQRAPSYPSTPWWQMPGVYGTASGPNYG